MTKSNRDAAANGELGGNVLEQKIGPPWELSFVTGGGTGEILETRPSAPKRAFEDAPDIGAEPWKTIRALGVELGSEAKELTMHFRRLLGHEMTDFPSALALAGEGPIILPEGVDVQVLEPHWQNPTLVERGQIWDAGGNCPRGWTEDGLLTVMRVEGYRVEFRRASGSPPIGYAVEMLKPKSGYRCVGYELRDRSRIMVGEHRADEIGCPWRVTMIQSGASVFLKDPTSDSTSVANAGFVATWREIRWPVANALLKTWSTRDRMRFTEADDTTAAGRAAMRETSRRVAEAERLRTITMPEEADHLFGAGSELAGRCRGMLALWGGAIDVAVPQPPTDTFKPIDSKAHAAGIDRWKTPRSLFEKGDVYFRKDVAEAPEEVLAMRAECAAFEVVEGEHNRTASPPSADCGPSFVRGPSSAVQAMIDAGFTVDPSLL